MRWPVQRWLFARWRRRTWILVAWTAVAIAILIGLFDLASNTDPIVNGDSGPLAFLLLGLGIWFVGFAVISALIGPRLKARDHRGLRDDSSGRDSR